MSLLLRTIFSRMTVCDICRIMESTSKSNSKRAGTRRSRQNNNPGSNLQGIRDLLSNASRDSRPLHVSVDNNLFMTCPSDIESIPRGLSQQKVFNVTGAYETFSVLTTSTTLDSHSENYIQLSNLNQSSSWTAVFDQYRIVRAEARFIPHTAGVTTSPFVAGVLTSVIDYDDATNIGSQAAALDYQNELTVATGQPFIRTFTPHAAAALYSGAFSSFGNVASPWIDAASPNVQHYGIKLYAPPQNAVVTYDMTVKLWLQFRNVR